MFDIHNNPLLNHTWASASKATLGGPYVSGEGLATTERPNMYLEGWNLQCHLLEERGVGDQVQLQQKVKSLSRVRLFATPWTVAYQPPPSMWFSRQEYWGGLPFPSPGDLPDPGIEPGCPAFQVDALTSEPRGKPSHSTGCNHLCPLPKPGYQLLKIMRFREVPNLWTHSWAERVAHPEVAQTLCAPNFLLTLLSCNIHNTFVLSWVVSFIIKRCSQPSITTGFKSRDSSSC